MPGAAPHALHALWIDRDRADDYVGTLNGFRAALKLLGEAQPPVRHASEKGLFSS